MQFRHKSYVIMLCMIHNTLLRGLINVRVGRQVMSPASTITRLSVIKLFSTASTPSTGVAQNSFERNIDYYNIPENKETILFGDYKIIASNSRSLREFADVKSLGADSSSYKIGDSVWIRGRVNSVRAKGNAGFLVVRSDGYYTIQTCHFKDKSDPENSKALIKFLGGIPLESIIDIQGTVVTADVKSCSQNNVEIQLRKVFVVSRAPVNLPFLLEDAARSDEVIEASQTSERPFARVTQEMRLNNRWLDLRVPANIAIMKIKSGVTQLFREALYDKGFLEIQSPKLIAGESEGGADVFRTDYFGQPACLAQSPQLYKQMAISADLERVFEVGPVFRAENSKTRRHLCEFTGLDLEMSIIEHYRETLEVIHSMFKRIFTGLEERYGKELAVIREQYPSQPVRFTEEPLVIHWDEAIQMLRDAGEEVADPFADLSSPQEVVLGNAVAEKYKADFFIVDQYPSAVRPFYTMPNLKDPRYSNSYDIFIRGQEICSGAQRCHEPEMLVERIQAKGVPLEPLQFYVDSFRHAVKPHAGAGIGLERVVFLYLGLDNVRKASMFPRDPNRIAP